tara:strand:- start:136 stop:501 length:366 start_codon:yes stop_codon:yes gene_type:complete
MYREKYLKYKLKYMELKKQLDQKNNSIEVQKGGSSDKKQLYLFKAEWCPHCVAFKPVWAELEKKYEKTVDMNVYDSDKNGKTIKQWKINGFPTIIMKHGNKAIEYAGPRTLEDMIDFIENN